MTYMGVTFDEEVHTYDDFGLRITSVNIGMPEVKDEHIEIPGMDGYLDMTDYFGTRYKNRKITLQCDFEDGGYDVWAGIVSQISNYLHGKKRKIVLDWDPAYYYVGRGKCKYDKNNRIYGKLTLEFDCEPYKYEIITSDDDWLWDPFDFETGVIREYHDLAISGTSDLIIIGSPMPVVPRFVSSADMTLEYEGATYQIKAGTNYFPELEITDGEHTMRFTGSGTISISYKAGSL